MIVKTKCETDGSFYSTTTQVGTEAGLEDGLQAGVEAGLPGQGLQPRHPHQTSIPGTENWILQINSDPFYALCTTMYYIKIQFTQRAHYASQLNSESSGEIGLALATVANRS